MRPKPDSDTGAMIEQESELWLHKNLKGFRNESLGSGLLDHKPGAKFDQKVKSELQ